MRAWFLAAVAAVECVSGLLSIADDVPVTTDDLVTRIRERPNDAPLPTEYLLDDAADEIERLRTELAKIRDYKLPDNVTAETGITWLQILANKALS